jgi:O-acetyl-ADP-ribose deacetylase
MDDVGSLRTLRVGERGRIELLRGDITSQDTCAVVNAANSALAPGGGVCGAIHRAAGNEPFSEAAEIVRHRGPLSPGEAVATGGGRLKADYIVHAVGPVWHGGRTGETDALASAYRASVRVADSLGCESMSFPSISTGIYGFPVDIAAPIALDAVRAALSEASSLTEVRVVLYDSATARAWVEAADESGW